MDSSLDDLVEALWESGLGRDKFIHSLKYAKDDLTVDKDNVDDVLFHKGIYPYEFMDGVDKFDMTELPPRDKFYSKLKEEGVTDEQYGRAQGAWRKLGCKTMKDYHNFYLKMDVLLLADVFENFRSMCMSNFGLDPANYYTLPGFAWDACLKTTGQVLDSFRDISHYLFTENNLRGGISVISNRYAKANNEYTEEGFDKTKDKSFIIYLDCNGLYAEAMTRPLPTGAFRFWTNDEIRNRYDDFEYSKIHRDSDMGYILEVDLEYPEDLHDIHNDYPLAPERMTATEEMLGPYARSFPERPKPTEKLIPNLRDKTNYVLHYENLKLYLDLGMKLKRVHQVLEFRQSAWMKPYVDLCTENRRNAKSEFAKNFWKLCINAVYGKSMENVRNHMNLRLIHDSIPGIKAVAKPTFVSSKIINEDLVLIKMAKLRLMLDKPIYTGFSILDISKTVMYEFHYKHIVKKYGYKNVKLLFTDTDSLCYHIKTDDIYQDMKANLDYYDTSNFDSADPNPLLRSLYSKKNCKVLGKFKSETGSLAPITFVGLRAKMYSLEVGGDKFPDDGEKDDRKLRAKGIKRSFIRHHINHAAFLNTLRTARPTEAEFLAFASKNQQLKTLLIKKVGLSAFDDKRFIKEDGETSYAYGHYRIPKPMPLKRRGRKRRAPLVQ